MGIYKQKISERGLWSLFGDFFNCACCDGGAHVSYCESAEFWEVNECFDCDWVEWFHAYPCCVSCFEVAWVLFGYLSCAWVDFLYEFSEFYCDLSCVIVKYWCVSCCDGCWVVDYDDLSDEFFCYGWWVVNWTCNVSAVDIGLCDASERSCRCCRLVLPLGFVCGAFRWI